MTKPIYIELNHDESQRFWLEVTWVRTRSKTETLLSLEATPEGIEMSVHDLNTMYGRVTGEPYTTYLEYLKDSVLELDRVSYEALVSLKTKIVSCFNNTIVKEKIDD